MHLGHRVRHVRQTSRAEVGTAKQRRHVRSMCTVCPTQYMRRIWCGSPRSPPLPGARGPLTHLRWRICCCSRVKQQAPVGADAHVGRPTQGCCREQTHKSPLMDMLVSVRNTQHLMWGTTSHCRQDNTDEFETACNGLPHHQVQYSTVHDSQHTQTPPSKTPMHPPRGHFTTSARKPW